MVGFFLFAIDRFAEAERESDKAQFTSTARALSSAVDAKLQTGLAVLSVLGTAPSLSLATLEVFYARCVAAGKEINASFLLMDASGRELLFTEQPFGAAPADLQISDLAKEALDAKAYRITDVYFARRANAFRVSLLFPVFREDGETFVIVMTFDAEQIGQILTKQHLPDSWTVGVVDRQNTIVARTRAANEFVGKPVNETLLGMMGQASEAGFTSTTLEGVPVFTTFTKSALSGWTVAIGIPLADINAPMLHSLWTLGLADIAMLLAAAGLAVLIGRQMSRSLAALSKSAISLGHGRPLPPTHSRIREVNEVAAAHEVAAELLRQRESEREKARSLLEATNLKLQALIDSSPLAIVGLDTNCRVVTWSRAAERIFGYAAAEIIGEPYPLVPDGAREEFDGLFRRVCAGEYLRDITVKRRHKDGKSLDVVFSGAPLYDAQHQVIGAVYVLEDVSEKKRIEQRLAQAQKMEAVGQLTGGIAHDFNNMLGVVIGNLDELIEASAGQPAAQEPAMAALDGALRAAELVRQLLAFSRRQPLAPKLIDIGQIVHGTDPLLRRTLGEQITIQTRIPGDLWPAVADPTQFENTILNLAINARDAMPLGGQLTIQCANVTLDEAAAASMESVVGDYVTVTVSDTGTGIPPEVLPRVFEPFFTTKETGKGSGLGLSMVYGYARQSGGAVKIYSEAGHGTDVRLYLPRALGPAERAGHQDQDAAAPRGSERIMVVEDKDDVRTMAARLLRGLGYAVVEVESAAAALEAFDRATTVDLLFTDIVMPGHMSGIDLAHEVRRRFPAMPIVFTSGFSDPQTTHAELATIKATVISKPYRKVHLAQHLRAVLDQRS